MPKNNDALFTAIMNHDLPALRAAFNARPAPPRLAESDFGIYDWGGRLSTPLHCAAAVQADEIVSFLLDNGSPVDHLDGDGSTPFAVACQRNNHSTAKLLLKRGANPAGPTQTWTDASARVALAACSTLMKQPGRSVNR